MYTILQYERGSHYYFTEYELFPVKRYVGVLCVILKVTQALGSQRTEFR